MPLRLAERPPPGDLLLMLRPERLRILDGADPGDEPLNRLEATVADVVYQGDSYLMYARLPDGAELAVRGVVRSDTVSALPPVGHPVALGVAPRDTLLVPAGA
jgi:putative spermidine/putrescine transport system ATP-binding protein